MSTKSIYIPYTYLIGWSKLDKWYYGSKTSNSKKDVANPESFWVNYFTSSKEVQHYRSTHGEPDVIQVRRTFNNPNDCYSWEMRVLRRLKAVNSSKWINKHECYPGFNAFGKVTVKDTYGNCFLVPQDDPRYTSGELVHNTTGIVPVRDKDGNIVSVPVDDPRIGNELSYLTVGKMCVVDKDGNTFQADLDDPKVLSGEWVHHSKGQTTGYTPEGIKVRTVMGDPRFKTGELIHPHKGKKKSSYYCTHCKKDIAGAANYSRAHGENCVCNVNGPKFNKVLHDFIMFTELTGRKYELELDKIKKKLKKQQINTR